MMNYFKFFAVFACFSLICYGCAHKPPIVSENAKASMAIADAANQVSKDLNEINAIEKNNNQIGKKLNAPAITPNSNLDISMSVDWSGPIEPLLQRIADNCGYNLRIIGKKPAIPVLVIITAKDTYAAYLLRDANFQAANRAQVVVYPSDRIIELRYAK